jgi:hypothetical protein
MTLQSILGADEAFLVKRTRLLRAAYLLLMGILEDVLEE